MIVCMSVVAWVWQWDSCYCYWQLRLSTLSPSADNQSFPSAGLILSNILSSLPQNACHDLLVRWQQLSEKSFWFDRFYVCKAWYPQNVISNIRLKYILNTHSINVIKWPHWDKYIFNDPRLHPNLCICDIFESQYTLCLLLFKCTQYLLTYCSTGI